MLRVQRLDLEDDVRVSQPEVLRARYGRLGRRWKRLSCFTPASVHVLGLSATCCNHQNAQVQPYPGLQAQLCQMH